MTISTCFAHYMLPLDREILKAMLRLLATDTSSERDGEGFKVLGFNVFKGLIFLRGSKFP